jgi:hypothetical protein
MCQFISFFHRPDNGDIAVSVLDHHDATMKKKIIQYGVTLLKGKA